MDSLFEHRYWNAPDGLKLHYRDYIGPADAPGRPPVLCLHGLTRNARDFEGLAAHLSEHFRVIVPEMRGRGMSDYAPDSSSYNPMVYVADVKALLEELEIDRFISIGTSMGGLMTMLMAAMEPDRIIAAVLNDIGPDISADGIERIKTYVGQGGSYPTWVHAARSLQSVHSASFPDFDLEQWLVMAKRTLVVGQNGRISYDYDMAIAEPFSVAEDATPPDLWPAFDGLKGSPVLLLRGALSDLLTPETVVKMQERHPDLRVVTVPRVGHAPTLDEEASREAIVSFLSAFR